MSYSSANKLKQTVRNTAKNAVEHAKSSADLNKRINGVFTGGAFQLNRFPVNPDDARFGMGNNGGRTVGR